MSTTKVDVIDLIDRHPVTGFQIGVLILCMLVAALDGFDTQAIGYTAPAMAGALKLPMAQFGQVGSAGLVGAAIGALSFGPFADMFGRKWFMILAIVVFAIFTFMTAQSASLQELLAYRFLAGLGLGGATPAFLAMGAELAPKRLRDVFVTVLFASFPAGGLIGSLTSAWVIPAFGWRSVFYIGAVAPLVIGSFSRSGCLNPCDSCSRSTFATTKFGARSSGSCRARFPLGPNSSPRPTRRGRERRSRTCSPKAARYQPCCCGYHSSWCSWCW